MRARKQLERELALLSEEVVRLFIFSDIHQPRSRRRKLISEEVVEMKVSPAVDIQEVNSGVMPDDEDQDFNDVSSLGDESVRSQHSVDVRYMF